MTMAGTSLLRLITSDNRTLSVLGAMVSPHGVDRYTELAAPMVTVDELRARVTSVHWETETSVTVVLEPTRQWRGFSAGQYVRIGVVVDGVRHTRCFSPCNSEHRADGRIELTVKAHGHAGPSVARELYDRARPGLMVELEQAAGEFRLPHPRPRDVVLISGGSGITPALSMLRTLDDERRAGKWHGRVALLHYARGPRDVTHRGELRRLGERSGTDVGLIYTGGSAEPHSAPDGSAEPHSRPDGALRGHFSTDHLDAVAPWLRGSPGAQTYLCGPPRMMDAVRGAYARLGREDSLHTEEFTAASFELPDADGGGEATGAVTFSATGTSADNDGRVLLEQAEAAGLAPEYGCRMGICFTCTSVRRSGCTRNLVTGEAGAEPDQPIQLCVNVPVGDVDIDI